MKDALFLRVVYVLVGLIVIYALVLLVVFLAIDPSDDLIVRFISGFGTIFTAILGLCTGYLIGSRNGNGKP